MAPVPLGGKRGSAATESNDDGIKGTKLIVMAPVPLGGKRGSAATESKSTLLDR